MVADLLAQRQQMNLNYEKRTQFGVISQNRTVTSNLRKKFKPSAHQKILVQMMQNKLNNNHQGQRSEL